MGNRTRTTGDWRDFDPVDPEGNGLVPDHAHNLTDLGNAGRFVDEHGDRVRYCPPWGKWLTYDGRRWVPDETGEVERMMKATVRNIYAEAAEADKPKDRKAIADHAKRSESAKRITDALRLARSEEGIPVLPRQLDADPWLLNAENGTIDLRTGGLREHQRDDLITKLAPVEYDPDAEAPTFGAFMERILPSETLRGFVRRVVGYASAGVVSEEVLVILYGVGANGKSTLVNAVMEALGDYAKQAAPDLLLAKRGAHPTELADLFGARFLASVETDEYRRLAEGLVKQLTGRDKISARRMREDFWQFDPTHTIFLATNHRPEVKGTDHAIWRRLKLAPFDVAIPEAEQDKELPEKLRAEMPGILAWIVGGCLEWLSDGLGEPEEVKAATTTYREDMDILAGFIEDRCVVDPDAWAKFSSLYSAYQNWCEESGEKAETRRRFGTRLKERGFLPDKGTDNVSIRRGIGLGIDGGGGPGGGGPQDAPNPEQNYPPTVIAEARNYSTVIESNHDRYAESDEQDDQNYSNYSDSHITDNNPSHVGLYAKQSNYDNSSNSPILADSPGGGSPTPRGRRLTTEEAAQVQRLRGQGMSARDARAEVLGRHLGGSS